MSAETETPVRELRVRRRLIGGVPWLALDNYFVELDDVTDAVWRACDGTRTIRQIADALGDTLGDEPAERTSVVAQVVGLFRESNLVSVR